ncbi:MAG: hypothetical protein V4506_16020 [Bacteroidota bacterium]
MKKNTNGGKRPRAGRKKIADKKMPVTIFLLESKIDSLGGLESTKDHLYNLLTK